MKRALEAIGGTLYKYRFFFERLLIALLTLAICTMLTFFFIKMMPGDIVDKYAQELATSRNMNYEDAKTLAVSILNYDPSEPFFTQFGRYVSGLFHGNLGQSIYYPEITANVIIEQSLPWSLFLSSTALFLSYFIGTAMGSYMAYKRKKASNVVFDSYIVVSSSIPDYLFGLIILYIFGYSLGWFPSYGNYSIETAPGFTFQFIGDVLYHAFLPIFAYTFTQIGGWALMMEGSTIAVLGEDYVNAALARGLPPRVIVRKYLKKNAKLPLITSLSISFGYLFGGSAIMETIFKYPGIGYAFSRYIGLRDYFVMEGLFFFMSAIIILANFISDSLYSVIDPRVRKSA
jgi:peptide/nickel transport system permease protein